METRRPAATRTQPNAATDYDTGARSLWSTSAGIFSGESASGDVETDVAVVGAGVAGLSTGLHLQERGIETVVLEAEYPGSAATGASGGIIAPEFAREGIARACRLYGDEQGERLARLVGESATFTFDLIERHAIDCAAQRAGFVSPGRTHREIEALRADGGAWTSLGFPVSFLDAGETAAAIGSDVYGGALRFDNGGALNPLAYATGLARVLRDAGVPVFTNSPVQGLGRDGKWWRLRTPEARVRARRVVLAANGGNAVLHPSLRAATLPLLVYEYATPPLSDAERARCFGAGLPYTDRQTYVFTARLTDEGRVVSALPEIFPKWDDAGFLQEADRRLREICSMSLPAIDFTWPGTAYLNPSLLPAVYLPEGDASLVALQACNGRGLGINTILGREVAAMLASGKREALAVPLLPPRSIPVYTLAVLAPKVLLTLAQIKSRWRRRRPVG